MKNVFAQAIEVRGQVGERKTVLDEEKPSFIAQSRITEVGIGEGTAQVAELTLLLQLIEHASRFDVPADCGIHIGTEEIGFIDDLSTFSILSGNDVLRKRFAAAVQ